MRLTARQLTRAIARFARRYGYSSSTVRTVTVLRYQAINEWLASQPIMTEK